MTYPIFHAESSVRRFGGSVEDYQPIHDWLDVIWTLFNYCHMDAKLTNSLSARSSMFGFRRRPNFARSVSIHQGYG